MEIGVVNALVEGTARNRPSPDGDSLPADVQRGPRVLAQPLVPLAPGAEVRTDEDAAVIGDHPDDGFRRPLAILGCRFDPNLALPPQPGQVSRRERFHGCE